MVLVSVPLILPVPLAAIPVAATVLSLVQLNTVPATLPVNTIVVMAEPEQMTCVAGVATALGTGFTTTVAVMDGPVQVTPPLVKEGVIVNVTVTGALVRLVKLPLINVVPDPLDAIPIAVALLSLVQSNTVPGTLPVKLIVVIAEPEQIVCDDGVATALGTGFTTTVAVMDGPVQVTPAFVNDGVIVNVTVTGALVVLVNVPLILPAPLAAIPVTATVLSLVQLNTVPATLPLKLIVPMAEPEQMVCDDGVATALGIGFTTTSTVNVAPVHVTPALV